MNWLVRLVRVCLVSPVSSPGACGLALLSHDLTTITPLFIVNKDWNGLRHRPDHDSAETVRLVAVPDEDAASTTSSATLKQDSDSELPPESLNDTRKNRRQLIRVGDARAFGSAIETNGSTTFRFSASSGGDPSLAHGSGASLVPREHLEHKIKTSCERSEAALERDLPEPSPPPTPSSTVMMDDAGPGSPVYSS